MCPRSHKMLIGDRAQDTGMCPQEGVLLSLGVDVYVRGNPTWMGLCVHACFLYLCLNEFMSWSVWVCIRLLVFFRSSLLFLIFRAEMQLIRLCIQVFESTQRRRCWLRVFPLSSGLKVETLLQQALNLEASRHVRACAPTCRKEVSPGWWLGARRSRPEGQGFSHHCYLAAAHSTTNTPNTPPTTPPLQHDIIEHTVTESGGGGPGRQHGDRAADSRHWLGLAEILAWVQQWKKVRQPQHFICPVWHN